MTAWRKASIALSPSCSDSVVPKRGRARKQSWNAACRIHCAHCGTTVRMSALRSLDRSASAQVPGPHLAAPSRVLKVRGSSSSAPPSPSRSSISRKNRTYG